MHGSSSVAVLSRPTREMRGCEGVGSREHEARSERLVSRRTDQDLPARHRDGGALQGSATPVPVRHGQLGCRLETWIAHPVEYATFAVKAQATLMYIEALTVSVQ
jgi:hypothetical protein